MAAKIGEEKILAEFPLSPQNQRSKERFYLLLCIRCRRLVSTQLLFRSMDPAIRVKMKMNQTFVFGQLFIHKHVYLLSML